MKRYAVHMGSMVLGVLLLSTSSIPAEEQTVLKSQSEKENYATGVEFVRSLQKRGGSVNLDLVIQGMKDGLTGEKMLMGDDELRKTFAASEPASQQDTSNPVSAETDQSKPAAPQKQVNPGRADDPVPANMAFAKQQGPAQLTGQGNVVNGQFVPFTQSLAQRGHDRNALKLRALELRKQSIQQGL